MKRTGLGLLILILAAAIVLFLFTGQMKRMKGSVNAPAGENPVQQAQEAVDAINDRMKQSYTGG
ncbi:MAG: hypothetical protein IKO68_06030 [Oscillospiraceae bacterium]|nr:hypothetical protein [Oscillospiraceae bacterium]